jgi:hypothetical protein
MQTLIHTAINISLGETMRRSEPTNVEQSADELWLGVKYPERLILPYVAFCISSHPDFRSRSCNKILIKSLY